MNETVTYLDRFVDATTRPRGIGYNVRRDANGLVMSEVSADLRRGPFAAVAMGRSRPTGGNLRDHPRTSTMLVSSTLSRALAARTQDVSACAHTASTQADAEP